MSKEILTTSDGNIDETKVGRTSSTSNDTVTTAASASTVKTQNTTVSRCIIQNFRLIWLDFNIDKSEHVFPNFVTQLRRIVVVINTFTNVAACVEYLNHAKDEKILMIVSNYLGQHIIPLMHDMSQLDAVFMLCDNNAGYEQWIKSSSKVRGVFTEFPTICKSIEQLARQYDQDCISISFASKGGTNSENFNKLDNTSIYILLLKETLFEIDYDQQSIKNLADYCCKLYNSSDFLQNITSEFEREYGNKSPVWWYSNDCFLYRMLNRAIDTHDIITVNEMGFFIQDLNRNIAKLHSSQFTGQQLPFTVYRGQGLSLENFEKLMKIENGIISFNNFLCASKNRNISLNFAIRATANPDLVGVLFHIFIDPSISSIPYALVDQISQCEGEEEILFPMHTVFHIGEIKHIENNDRLWEVKIRLIPDKDLLFSALVEQIWGEPNPGSVGWDRLTQFLLNQGKSDKIEYVYQALIDRDTMANRDKAHFYHQMGNIRRKQGDHDVAISFYEKAIELREKTLPPNDSLLAVSYHNIGLAHHNLRNYSSAISFYEKAVDTLQATCTTNEEMLAICYTHIADTYNVMEEYSKAVFFYKKIQELRENTVVPNDSALATTYQNFGILYENMGSHAEALVFYEKALGIREKTLPSDDLLLATIYNSIASVYNNMEEYSSALRFYIKVLEIREKVLLTNDLLLATTYHAIGRTYNNINDHPKALTFYEKALEIREKVLPSSDLLLATTYNNIGWTYKNMNDYTKSLSFYHKSLEIREKALPSDDLLLATTYHNIALAHYDTEEYSKALPFYVKALEIREKILPVNDLLLATTCNDIGWTYHNINNYPKALLFHDKALAIREKILPSESLLLAITFDNVATMNNDMGEYSKALPFYSKALEIREKVLPDTDPVLADTYNDIAWTYKNMGEYPKALSFYEKALGIREKALPVDDHSLATTYNSIGLVYDNMNEYPKALSLYEKALEVYEAVPSADVSLLATVYHNIGSVYNNTSDYPKALLFHKKAFEIREKVLTSDDPLLATTYHNIGVAHDSLNDYPKALLFHEKALEIREKILPPNNLVLARTYVNIGLVYNQMHDYPKALLFHQKALEIREQALSADDLLLATTYNNVAAAYDERREYSTALAFYEKALKIREKVLDVHDLLLATTYSRIALVYDNMRDYPKALLFNEKALEIREKALVSNDLSLATTYRNIGIVYDNMNEYSKALSFYEKALEIREKVLPPNDSLLATIYNNIGSVYKKMHSNPQALSFHQKALDIHEKILSPRDPVLAITYDNIALVYYSMDEYSKALPLYVRALEIREKALPPSDPLLATTYNNIGLTYEKMGEHLNALSFYQKVLEIREKVLSPNDSLLATIYNSIASIYYDMEQYSEALPFYLKTLEIREKTCPLNNSLLATTYVNTGLTYDYMREYSKAISLFEKALELREKLQPPNDLLLAETCAYIASAYFDMEDYSKALSFYTRALEIREKVLPANDLLLATTYKNIGSTYSSMNDYSKALSFYEKALEIREKNLPPDHSHIGSLYYSIACVYSKIGSKNYDMNCLVKALSYYRKDLEFCQNTHPEDGSSLAIRYSNLGCCYYDMGDYSKALSFLEKAVENWKKDLPANGLSLATTYTSIGWVYNGMEEYSKALSSYEKALELRLQLLSSGDPAIQASRGHVEMVRTKLENMQKLTDDRIISTKTPQQSCMNPNEMSLISGLSSEASKTERSHATAHPSKSSVKPVRRKVTNVTFKQRTKNITTVSTSTKAKSEPLVIEPSTRFTNKVIVAQNAPISTTNKSLSNRSDSKRSKLQTKPLLPRIETRKLLKKSSQLDNTKQSEPNISLPSIIISSKKSNASSKFRSQPPTKTSKTKKILPDARTNYNPAPKHCKASLIPWVGHAPLFASTESISEIRSTNYESNTLIWLDADIHLSDMENKKLAVRQIIDFLLTFDTIDQCQKEIAKVKSENVFLIVTDLFVRDILIHVHDLKQISSIYIYRKTPHVAIEWANEYQKVRGVFDEFDALHGKLAAEINLLTKVHDDTMPMKICDPSSQERVYKRNNTEIASYFYTLVEELVSYDDPTSKEQMLDIYRYYYKGNKTQEKFIDEFEKEYRSEKAIWWYTRESCIFRLLNKASRIQDEDTLVRMRFIIIDIYKQLIKEHKLFVASLPKQISIVTVYRGQRMSCDELTHLKNSIDKIVIMNSFLSTSLDKQVALSFLNLMEHREGYTKVLFQIEIDTTLSTKPYAEITHLSAVKQERELLCMLGSLFRIRDISNDGTITSIKLSLCSEEDDELLYMRRMFVQTIGHESPLILKGWLQSIQMDGKGAEKYFENLLDTLPLDDFKNRSSCHYHLTKMPKCESNPERLVEMAKKALENALEAINTIELDNVVRCYNLFGKICSEHGYHDLAVETFQNELTFLLKYSPGDRESIALSQYAVGRAHHNGSHFDKAVKWYEITIDHRLQIYPKDHATILLCYQNIGVCYENQQDYHTAIIWYQKAIDNSSPNNVELAQWQQRLDYLKTSVQNIRNPTPQELKHFICVINEIPLDNVDNNKELELLEITHNNNMQWLLTQLSDRGYEYYCNNNDTQGAIYLKRAVQLELQVVKPNFHRILRNSQYLGEILYRGENYEFAMNLLRETSIMEQMCVQHAGYTRTYEYIGHIHINQKNHSEALLNYTRALELHKLHGMSDIDSALIDIYSNMTTIYEDQGNYSQVLLYYSKLANVLLNDQPINYSFVATVYENIGWQHNKLENHIECLEYHKKALECAYCIVPSDFSKIVECCDNAATACIVEHLYVYAIYIYLQVCERLAQSVPKNNDLFVQIYESLENTFDADATDCYKRALKIGLKEDIDESKQTLISRCMMINELCTKFENYDIALSHYCDSLEVNQNMICGENISPLNSKTTGRSYKELHATTDTVSDYSNAIQTLKENPSDDALEQSQLLLSIYINLTLVLGFLERWEDAIIILTEAMAVDVAGQYTNAMTKFLKLCQDHL